MEIPIEWIGAAITFLFVTIGGGAWKYFTGQNKALVARMDNQAERLESKLDKCEERHLERDEHMLDLTAKVGRLEGMEAMTQRIESVVKEAIREVSNDS